MSAGSAMTTVICSAPYLARMSVNLFWIYVTLGHRVRKTRNAFEQQLILGGMSKDDAKRLGACFEVLKNDLTSMLKQGVAGSFRQRIIQ